GGWSVDDGREPQRDEVAFAHQVLADAVERFGVDPNRTLVTGFSRGGSLVWDIACASGPDFPAYASIAGGFWRPYQTECRGPIQMFHVHGFVDTTVPLEGRPLRNGTFEQGDIFAGFQVLRRTNQCTNLRPDTFDITEGYRCRLWTECGQPSDLRLCLHDGGHTVPPGWANRVLDWFEAL
ncbi:MAG: polyhydroxybutyrate depolymerase, partial [Pseudomonadota bacterium]